MPAEEFDLLLGRLDHGEGFLIALVFRAQGHKSRFQGRVIVVPPCGVREGKVTQHVEIRGLEAGNVGSNAGHGGIALVPESAHFGGGIGAEPRGLRDSNPPVVGVGINIGAVCNNFMIDISGPAGFLTFKTNASGNHSPWTYIKLADLATARTLGGLEIWSQGAWTDSKTGAFSLTSCERCRPSWTYPILNDPKLLPRKKTLYYYNNTNLTGNGFYDYYYYNPVTRYN